MLIYAAAYVASLFVFLVLEGGWLTFAGPRLYKPEIGSLLAEKPRLPPAAVFYLLYVAGVVWFAVTPNIERGWTSALLDGAILGLIAYGTYDLTCAATMKTWSIKVTIADMAWGAVATGAASTAGVLAARRFFS
jgi:uncharacterized membrane protein